MGVRGRNTYSDGGADATTTLSDNCCVKSAILLYNSMLLARILSGLLCFIGFTSSTAIDVIGSSGCTASACVFANPNLRFGTGVETSVNAWGLFVQPWYYSHTASAWYKLTYYNYPLDTAIGTGTGSAHWSGTTIVNLYDLTPTNPATDYSNFIVDSSDTAKSIGHGKIVATRTFVINGQTVTFENTFSLGPDDSFVKIISRVINAGSSTIQNMLIWTGTRDDFVGVTDSNTKTRGNLDTGSFVAVTSNTQSSHAIMITNTNEGVLFYSETPGVMTAYAMCCSFSNAYNVNPLSLAPMTPNPTDGSYAAVLPIGNVVTGGSGSITWYYAAGAVTSLSTVAQNVAADQVANSSPVPTALPAPSAEASPSGLASRSGLASPSSTPSGLASRSGGASAAPSPSALSSESILTSPSSSTCPSVSTTPSASASSFASPTSVPSSKYTTTVVFSYTPPYSVTPLSSASSVMTATATSSSTPTPSSTSSMTPAPLPESGVSLKNMIIVSAVSVAVLFVLVSLLSCCAYWCLIYRKKSYCKECKHCTEGPKPSSIRDHLRDYEPFASRRPKQAFAPVAATV